MTAGIRPGQGRPGEIVTRLFLPEGQPSGFYLLILATFIAIVASIIFALIAVDHAHRQLLERNLAFAGRLVRWTSISLLLLLFAYAGVRGSDPDTPGIRFFLGIASAASAVPLLIRPRWRVLFVTASIGLGVTAGCLMVHLGYPAVLVLFPYGVIMIVAGLIAGGRGCSRTPQAPSA